MEPPVKRTKEDFAVAVARGTIASIPIVGGGAVEFFNLVVGDPAQKRRDEFYEKLVTRLGEIEGSIDAISPEKLASNEQFQATFIECAQISARTVHESKKELLRNAIINSAIATNMNETVRALFVQFTDRFTVDHIRLLRIYNDPKSVPAAAKRLETLGMGSTFEIIRAAAPDLARNQAICEILLKDLQGAGLMDDAGLHTTMSRDGVASSRTTALGKLYIEFLSDPETNKLPSGIESTPS
ncbi:hypothetical protein [Limoniibacter endophyticus]|uniref:Uncharacterized protein n=1 Tax=Limoniibacter endophyticus TaxID=1565040 RepID=A0A8J3DLG8_9HYPH|nr:hypothetical protein [Limoniibacter endophyticus]GHC79453.1 hypothetical protein GCM10010136_32000 [Limoniibacter endophyticus]